MRDGGGRAGLLLACRRLREAAYLMVGLPDYDRYVAHRRTLHPGEAMMTWPEFVRERTARRYGGDGTNRCC
jgi:uncharacterized short protein YbdD (DUF466 family)